MKARKSVRALLLAGITAAVLALPAPASARTEGAQAEPLYPYIVVLDENVLDALPVATELGRRYAGRVGHVYEHALKGFSVELPARAAKALSRFPGVSLVEPDLEMTRTVTQTGATWGIDRIDQRSRPLSGTYTYTRTGAGVTAYIIDTGIRFTHQQFGGRAVSGADFIDGGQATDCNGHGTHVAGTVGGSTYGVAKGVRLVAVRVLSCSGSGSTSGVIAGVDWVTGNHQAGQPAVANMSLGGGASSSLDAAVNRSINDGVSYAIAAGNSNANACNASPARVPNAMTIGATGSNDARASFSNFGSCVDWFAPGVGITSAWSTSNTAIRTISGTSMATPHTAGVAALYLQGNPGASPATVRSALFNLTTKSIVTSSNTTNNHLLFTNF
jgi:subtilisin family serine protease